MKKKQLSGDTYMYLRKTLLVMRLTLLFLLIGSAVAFSSNTYSQNVRLKLEMNNAKVKEVMTAIEDQSEFIFFYQDQHVDLDRRVNISISGKSIEEVLSLLFEGTDNSYTVRDRQIVIAKSPEIEPIKPSVTEEKSVVEMQQPQRKEVSGLVRDSKNQPMPGVAVIVKGTTIGTVTDNSGRFRLEVPVDAATLEVSFVGMKKQELPIEGRSTFEVVLEEESFGVDEVIVVGYGTQKKSDITGTVASLNKERLEMVPNLNIAQAIQGSVPGIMIQQSSSGASPSESIMIRGRNSILADNTPLIVMDGIPYGGAIRDINPNDVQSIEILKDASAAAIYGSRGSNGVILITTKAGTNLAPKISYDGYYSVQNYANYPEYLDGAEFYDFKMKRFAGAMTASEKRIYESGEWVDWTKLGTRTGNGQQHSLSVSGGFNNTSYYIAGNLLDVKGLMLNDDYQRVTGRINVDTKIAGWFTLGTRTQLSFDDRSGSGPDLSYLSRMNPLTRAFEEDGSQVIYIWEEDTYFWNPLQPLLFDNIDESYQVVTNNYAIVDFPFLQGLSYRINSGVRARFSDTATYMGRDTKDGLEARGSAQTNRSQNSNVVIENILTYNRDFGAHNIFLTGLYSYEKNKSTANSLTAKGFPHDFLKWYSAAQAELVTPGFSFTENVLMSQMLRLNYGYDSRYLVTLTGRRDGFSGFGADTKWGIFPSIALGWNIAREDFFPLADIVNDLKLRLSYGLNGNQAVGSYESISRLSEYNMVSNKQTQAGYIPSRLGQENLGWESSKTLNAGIDFALLESRITGDLNVYRTNTYDLLLNRSISPVHGITSITQNIGETQNSGVELSINSRNIVKNDFRWNTSVNFSFGQNKIVSLYGELDDQGNEIDDVANAWFIGKPIRVNYDFLWEGTWQESEAEAAAKWGSQPGFIKLQDVNTDGKLDAIDRQIIGQEDPKVLWGLTNSFSYGNFKLDIFVHGVHGVTKENPLMSDYVWADVRLNTIKKNWWTPENPTNEWIVNHLNAEWMAGIQGVMYENASFVRVKDISLSYDLPQTMLDNLKLDRLRLYVTGRNLMTFTEWRGLDPELSSQRQAPLQREFVFGLNLGF